MASPNLGLGLQYLGQLLGLLDDSGPVWSWFSAPDVETLKSMRKNRHHLARIIAALRRGDDLGFDPADPAKDIAKFPTADSAKGLRWESLVKDSQDEKPKVDAGLVWNEGGETDPLKIGIGAVVDTDIVDLSSLIWLFQMADNPKFDHLLGSGFVEADFNLPLGDDAQHPDLFLSKISPNLTVDKDGGDYTVNANIEVTEANTNPAVTKKLVFPSTDVAEDWELFGWNVSRIGIFILGAWLRWEANKPNPGDAYTRLSKHLMPMFGAKASATDENPIAALPPFEEPTADYAPANRVTLDDAKAWHESLIAPFQGGGTEAAERLIWHVKALITGNENKDLFSGSAYVQFDPVPEVNEIWDLGNVVLVQQPESAMPAAKFIGARFEGAPPPLDIGILDKKTPGTPPEGNFSSLMKFNAAGFESANLDIDTLTGGDVPFKIELVGNKPVLSVTVGVDPNKVTLELGLGNKPSLKIDGASLETEPIKCAFQVMRVIAKLLPASPEKDSVTGWFDAIDAFLDGVIPKPGQPAPDPVKLAQGVIALAVQSIKEAVGNEIEIVKIANEDVSFRLALKVATPFELTATLKFFPKEVPGIGIYIGEIGITSGITLPVDGTLPKVKLGNIGFKDLRASPPGNPSGVIAQFLPDFLAMAGYTLDVEWGGNGLPVGVSGGGRFPIELQLGPVFIQALTVSVTYKQNEKSFGIGLDAGFDLSGIKIAASDLGLDIHIQPSDPPVSLRLAGLALSADFSAVKLGGMFGAYKATPDANPDYLGAALVSVAEMFELSAIGGYTQMEDGSPSLFIFANLDAPLGGPPYFFVTGIAGGLGINRLKPSQEIPLEENPFMRVMRGEIAFDPEKGLGKTLEELGKHFAPSKGTFWIAAGIEFNSFAFINGKLLAVVQINPFAIEILGCAGFGIENLAYIEVLLQIAADTQSLTSKISITKNSYIIHPDIFTLSGDVAICAWYGSSTHAGDFLFSVGGYHDLYPPPDHYPKLNRIEVRATVFGFINVSIQAFFTLTPRDMMTGASVDLWAEFGDIKAGLSVYVDVYMKWDPFFLHARMGICLWFEFLGRHEIGVELEIWTPEFGGKATIDLAIVSFTIDFGAGLDDGDTLPVDAFVSNQLRLTPSGLAPVRVPPYAIGDKPGLFHVNVGWGRPGEQPAKQAQAGDLALEEEEDAQQGLDPNQPIRINPEFGLIVKTKLPVLGDTSEKGGILADPTEAWPTVSGKLHLALCGETDIEGCELKVSGAGPAFDAAQKKWPMACQPVDRYFPAAHFGADAAAEAQAGSPNRNIQVEQGAKAEKRIFGTGGVSLDFSAAPAVGVDIKIEADEENEGPQWPLDLDTPSHTIGGRVAGSLLKRKMVALGRGSKKQAMLMRATGPSPMQAVKLAIHSSPIPRVQSARTAYTVGSAPSGNVPGVRVIAVPGSPVRRRELAGVALRMVEPRQRKMASRAVRSRIVGRLSPAMRARAKFATTRFVASLGPEQFSVAPGSAVAVELSTTQAARGNLTLAGEATRSIRAIFLGGYGKVRGDVLGKGGQKIAIPAATRRVVLLGEEPDAPGAHEPMGLEGESMAIALEGHTFAGERCVVEVNAGHDTQLRPLTAVSGREVLRKARRLSVRFASPLRGALVISVRAARRDLGGAAENVRWSVVGAELGPVKVVARAEGAALIFPIAATGPFTLELSVERDWRVDGVVALPRDVRTLVTAMTRATHWSFIDRRWRRSVTTPTARPGAAPSLLGPAAVSAGAVIARMELLP